MRKVIFLLVFSLTVFSVTAQVEGLVNEWYMVYESEFSTFLGEINRERLNEDYVLVLFDGGNGEIWSEESSVITWTAHVTEKGYMVTIETDDGWISYLDLIEIQPDVYSFVEADEMATSFFTGYLYPASWLK